ncbi:MAG: DEAD/DEAH box helicase family protein [Prosthecobacter sp.]|uniref:DEAD/DEAH box helicase family protein n=1 Tax=Prosthecobacter sp. TaxID=1965333 RepID=UPI0025EB1A4E|nr:DEAD/DEAH box helicase family protein [Prosthecobacter sp.]MCF7784768.1 DEAD/DEAH box helicase family protein [Prosthecobacter sp.]
MISLRPFQEAPVESALSVFRYLAAQIPQLNETDRAAAVAQNGALLLHAPTGAGKTVMAGYLAEQMSTEHKVVWFWFTPFKGLVDQSEQSLRANFPGLRTRRLADDRNLGKTKAGDVWVTTWQLVAASNTDGRRVRNDREDNPSVDNLMDQLRQKGFMIGVIVDEAHHGFRKTTQAFEFYKTVIKPDFTLLVTATPDDKEAESFYKDAGFKRMPHIVIHRSEAVAAGLVKPSVRSVALIAKPGQENLVDFETTAIREATKTHYGIKAELEKQGIPLTPLMLVQVDSTSGTEKRVMKKLLANGFKEDQIALYTAKEPDASLRTLAYDTSKEVLVFKMAVALGFDAPRAWTLVSMRGIVDEDFGTQIVGRLMRVHELCQGKALPDALNHAYVFLADMESQKGLEQAADKLNRVKTQFASVAAYSVVVQVGGENQLQVIRNGQPELLPDEKTRPALEDLKPTEEETTGDDPPPSPKPVETGTGWFDIFGGLDQRDTPPTSGEKSATTAPSATGMIRYPMKSGIPARLRKETMKQSTAGFEEAIIANADLSSVIVLDGLRRAVEITRREKGIFDPSAEASTQTKIQATLDRQATELQAQQLILSLDGLADKKRLDELLLQRIAKELRQSGNTAADNADEVEYTQAMILVQHPDLLRKAQRKSLASFVEVVDASPLPVELLSDSALSESPGNIYGRMPQGMNTWETAFAEWLDTEAAEVVNWWHRNPGSGDTSVVTVLPDGSRFFPDFIISVKGRSKPDGILLVDTKRAINDDLNAVPKTVVSHREYGRAMILRKDGNRWMTVRYDETRDKNVEDQVLHPDLLAHFS